MQVMALDHALLSPRLIAVQIAQAQVAQDFCRGRLALERAQDEQVTPSHFV